MKFSRDFIVWAVLVLIFVCVAVWWHNRMDKCFYREPFVNVWTSQSKKLMNQTITDTVAALKSLNVQWMGAFGTLLGAVRHQDIIPWDDDADFYVDRKLLSNLPAFKKLLREKGYVVYNGNKHVPLKIYHKSAQLIEKTYTRWPFVDLFFYDVIGDQVIFDDTTSGKKVAFDTTDVFPLKEVPFGDISIFIPANSNAVLTKEFGPTYATTCVSTGYNHRVEQGIDQTYKIDCNKLTEPNVELKDIPAYIINLDRRPDRMTHATQQFEKIGLVVQRVSAVDAKTDEFKQFYDCIPKPKRVLTEVACAMSHLKVLNMFLEGSSPYCLIFEDDIVFPDALSYDLLNQTFQNARGMNILFLGHCYSNTRHSTPGAALIGKAMCNHAYIVSREGAKSIINTYTYSEAIDHTTEKLCERTSGLCYVAGDLSDTRKVRPVDGGLVYQLDEMFESDIGKSSSDRGLA